MTSPAIFYRERAQLAQDEADAAKLDNVRDRCLRAEAAWTAMADRAERTQKLRDKRESEVVTRIQAAAE
jgi:hypothetical protein